MQTSMKRASSRRFMCSAACAVSLAACGGTTATTVDLAPVSQSVGPDTMVLTFASNGDVNELSANGIPLILLTLANDSGASHGNISAIKSPADTIFASGARIDDTFLWVSATHGDTAPHGSAVYARIVPTSMPTTGSAAYTGDYTGFLRQNGTPTNDVTNRIRGSMHLTADFAANSVSGAITNRLLTTIITNTPDVGNLTTNVTLGAAPIDATGAFTGATTGGILVNAATWTPPVGTYSGLISGPTGNAVVGGVSIAHFSPGLGAFTEIGGFIGAE